MLATYYRQTTDMGIWMNGYQLHQDWYDTKLITLPEGPSHYLNQYWPTINDNYLRARLQLILNIQGANELT